MSRMIRRIMLIMMAMITTMTMMIMMIMTMIIMTMMMTMMVMVTMMMRRITLMVMMRRRRVTGPDRSREAVECSQLCELISIFSSESYFSKLSRVLMTMLMG